MAIFGNFKGTTQSEFKIGKSTGNKISTGSLPSSDSTLGDVFIDSANATIKVYNNAWVGVGETLTELNVDDGTLFVDSSNDTVSIGSTSSNEKLFVNGSLRLGTNPSLQFSGAYLDLRHSNGSATQIRVRDNNNGVDPIFKVYNANNTSEVFKVQGNSITVANTYVLPTSDGTANQVIVTDGNGTLSFATVASDLVNDTTPQLGGNLDAQDYNITNVDTLSVGTLSFVDVVNDYGTIDANTVVVTRDYGSISDDAPGYIQLTDLSITTESPSGNGSLSYSNTTGVFTFTPADTSSSLADLSGNVLSDLGDVSSSSPSDGQALVWNASGSTWQPGTVASVYGNAEVQSYLDAQGYSNVDNDAQTLSISGNIITISGSNSNVDLTSALAVNTDAQTLSISGNIITISGSNSNVDLTTALGNVSGSGGGNVAYDRTNYVANASQTTFTATYAVGYVDVYLNGIKLLDGTDFTASDGSNIVLSSAAASNDNIEIVAFGNVDILATGLTTISSNVLSDLSDVSSTAPSDGQALIWDNGNSIWQPGTVASAYGNTEVQAYLNAQGYSNVDSDAQTLSITGNVITISGSNSNVDLTSALAVNIVDDITPQLGGNLDSMGYNISNASIITATSFVGDVTGNITGTVSSLSNHDTADLAEGTNLYFTADRVRGNISVTDAGGDGSLAYNSGTGVITYTGPSQAEANTRIDARVSGGNGITYSSGVISVNEGYFDGTAGGTGFSANFEPSANNTYSLGSANNVWKDVHVGPGSLYINGQQVLSDNSGTITVSADAGQNLSITTSGAGDVELNAGAEGDIQLKSNVTLAAGKTITASGGLKLASNLNVNSQYINNLSNPVAAQDGATKAYVDGATYLTGGDGIDNTAGTLAVDSTVVRTSGTQTVGGAKTFSSDIVISGNLTVSGTQTIVNTSVTSLADNIIELNRDASGEPTEDAGLTVNRGSSADVSFLWDETADKWTVGSGTMVAGTFEGDLTGDVTGNVTGTVSTLSNHNTDSLSEGSANLYYTAARANSAMDAYLTSITANVDSVNGVTGVVVLDTGDIAENGNLYYTDARARTSVSVTTASPSGNGSLSYNNTSGVFTFTPADTSGGSSSEVVYQRTNYVANASQTTFTATYAPGYVDVYLNGIKLLDGTDFTASDGSNIVLSSSANSSDSVEIVAFGNVSILSSGIDNIVEDTTPQLGGNLDLNSNNITGTGNIGFNGVLTQGPSSYYTKQYVLYGTTTDATETEILIGGSTRISVPTDTTLFYEVSIVARRTDATGESGSWHLKGCADNFSGTVADVGNIYEIAVAADDLNWAVDVQADDTNNAINILVTGALSKTIRWTAVVKTIEVSG